jgi:HemY protein
MIRVLIFLAALALIAVGLIQLVNQPGMVTVTWHGITYGRPLWQAVLVLLAVIVLLMIVIGAIRALLRAPGNASLFLRTRRRSKGFNAVTQGMIAVGSGDVVRAQRQAVEAQRILGSEPLALLLRAQAAQLSGDRSAAENAFSAMLDDPETKPLGLRGLFVEARRRGDAQKARAIAAEAVKASPTLPWAGTALLEFQSVEKDWAGALATLARNADNRLIDKETAKRHRAVLLAARALEQAERDRSAAKASALDALKLAPGLVPAAVLAARLLSDGNDIRKAAKVLETAWRVAPHPDLAQAYMGVRHGDSARDRLSRVQTLAAQSAGHPESAIALARAALAAREFGTARGALAPLLLGGGATERVCLLMAEIEEAENGDTGRVREWLSRAVRAPRDPAWTADGFVSDVWQPVSPLTGRIDAFEWKTPVERLGGPLDAFADDVIADIDEPAQITAAEEARKPAPPPPPAPAPAPVVEPAKIVVVDSPKPVRKQSVLAVAPVVASHPVPDDPGTAPDQPPIVSRFPLAGE